MWFNLLKVFVTHCILTSLQMKKNISKHGHCNRAFQLSVGEKFGSVFLGDKILITIGTYLAPMTYLN